MFQFCSLDGGGNFKQVTPVNKLDTESFYQVDCFVRDETFILTYIADTNKAHYMMIPQGYHSVHLLRGASKYSTITTETIAGGSAANMTSGQSTSWVDDNGIVFCMFTDSNREYLFLRYSTDGGSTFKFMNGNYFEFQAKKIYITRSGYTGEDGFEISILNESVENFIKLLSDKGAKPIGLGARDTLRLEAGLCLYGHELNQDINPVQANLKWAISKRRREEGGFKGWENIKNDLQNGVSKIRVGIKPSGRIIAREGTKIFSSSGDEIGIVTSGTFGPSVNAPVAMGYIQSKFSEINNKILLEVRGKKHDAVVTKLPFYKKSYVK